VTGLRGIHRRVEGTSVRGPLPILPPRVGAERGDALWTLGGPSAHQADPVVGKASESHGEEHIEEIFGQLWAIPDSPRPRVSHGGGHLVWIRSDLVRERKIRPEDCHPVSRFQKFDKQPKTLSFARDIWGGSGKKQTFVEAVKKKVAMAEGGRWVWQADRPGRVPVTTTLPGKTSGEPSRARSVQSSTSSYESAELNSEAGAGGSYRGDPDGSPGERAAAKAKEVQHDQPSPDVMGAIDPRYKSMTCYNCGEPGYFVGICNKPKVCFICVVPGQYMSVCPMWTKSQPVASYMGSAADVWGFTMWICLSVRQPDG
jgi:hypothetical protein